MQGFNPDQFLSQTAGGFDPDGFLASTNEAAPPPENPHDLVPFIKAQGSGLWNLAKQAVGGATDAVMDPEKTAKDIGNSLTSSPSDYLEGAYRAARNVPILGNAMNTAVVAAHGIPGYLKGDPLAAVNAQDAFEQQQKEGDAKHEIDHPLTDFVQKNAGLVGLPAGKVAQVGTFAFDAFNKSLSEGNDVTTALKDARNAAVFVGMALKTGDAISAVPGVVGRYAAKEAGVTPEAIERYRADPEAVNNAAKYAKDPEALKNLVDDKVAPITAEVDKAQQGLADARDMAADARVQQPSAAVDNANAQADAIAPQVEDAQAVLASRRQPPQDLAAEIPEHLDTQGEKLHGISMEAFDKLADSGEGFADSDLSGAIDKQMDSLKIAGVVPSIGPDAAAYSALGQFKGMVEQIGDKIREHQGLDIPADPEVPKPPVDLPAPVVKQLIQQLDGVSKAAYSVNAGALSPEAAKSLAAVRRSFDQVLKASSFDEAGAMIPGSYAEKMSELAPQVQIVNDMSKIFGNEPAALNALKAAADPMTPRGIVIRKKLAEYDALNGTNFAERVADYYDKPKQNLENLRAVQTQLEQARNDAIEQHRQAYIDQQATAKLQLEQAKQQLAQQQQVAAGVNKLGVNSTEKVIPSVQAGRNFEARKQLEALDPELLQTIKDTGIAKQFQRPTTNGSRKAVMGRGLGGAAGAGLGGFMAGPTGAVIGGFVGQAAGGFVGGLADLYGGQAVKAALDAGIKLDKLVDTPYIKPIMAAAKRGPKALAVAHFLLNQTDPKYQQLNGAAQ